MGQRTSRLGIAVLVTLFLASPAAAATGDRPPALDTVRAVAERVAGWLEGIADRLTASEVQSQEERGIRSRRASSKSDTFCGPPEMGAGADPYG